MTKLVKRYDIKEDQMVLCPAGLARRSDRTFAAWFRTTGLKDKRDLRAGCGELGDQELRRASVEAIIAERAAYVQRP